MPDEPKAVFDPKAPDKETWIAINRMQHEAGALGKIFGRESQAAVNIAGAVALVLVVGGVFALFYPGGQSSLEAIKSLAPILTMTLGFLFGQKQAANHN